MGQVDWSKGATREQVWGAIFIGGIFGTVMSAGLGLVATAYLDDVLYGVGTFLLSCPVVSVAVFLVFGLAAERHGRREG